MAGPGRTAQKQLSAVGCGRNADRRRRNPRNQAESRWSRLPGVGVPGHGLAGCEDLAREQARQKIERAPDDLGEAAEQQ